MSPLNKLVRQNILDLKPYQSARDEYTGKTGVFLDANENPYGDWNRYPDPYQRELKALFAAYRGLRAEQLFIGNGSDEVIDLLFRIFCEPSKDKALAFTPSYGMYAVSAAINGVELIQVPMSDSFEIMPETIQQYSTDLNLKLMFVCSPNNPTGNCVSAEILEKLLNSFGGILVVDEAYIDFCPEQTCVALIEKYPNLIITQTMSKAWGLASVRVGIGIANEQLINLLNKVKPPYNVSGPNQEQAILRLKNKAVFESRLKQIIEDRDKLAKDLKALDLVLDVYPSKANFLLVKFENAQNIYESLIQEKVVVRNRNSLVKGCIRISVGTGNENNKLIAALIKIEHEEGIIYR